MTPVKKILKALIFTALAVLVLRGVESVFHDTDLRPYNSIAGFYQEPKNSLDAVFIGGSNTYEFFQPPLAWEDHGITVYSLTSPGMPVRALKYMMREAYKTQPDALLIVNLNEIKVDWFTYGYVHFLADYMPFSKNKVELVRELAPIVGFENFWDQLEFYFPSLRYHSRWTELISDDFYRVPDGLKGASTADVFLNSGTDLTADYLTTDARTELTEFQETVVNDMIAFCNENPDAKVLFVFVPQIRSDEAGIGQFNEVTDRLTAAGLDVFNSFSDIEAMGVDLRGDFYDENHMNVHGSLKFTKYFANYLVEHYGFTDKRGDSAYASWDDAAERYDAVIGTGALDYERAHAETDSTLDFPQLTACEAYGHEITVTWEPVDGADGYVVYHRPAGSVWERVAETSDTAYSDTGLEIGAKYSYTVIPVKNTDDGPVYGSYNRGILSAETTIPAPKMTEIWEDENGIAVKWEASDYAKDYYVYRRELDSEDWIMIAKNVKTDYYTDKGAKPGVSYAYTAAAYTNDLTGAHDPVGLIIERDK